MFESNIINIYGKKGQQWLDDLPKLIMWVEATYGLSNLKPAEALAQMEAQGDDCDAIYFQQLIKVFDAI